MIRLYQQLIRALLIELMDPALNENLALLHTLQLKEFKQANSRFLAWYYDLRDRPNITSWESLLKICRILNMHNKEEFNKACSELCEYYLATLRNNTQKQKTIKRFKELGII